MMELAVPDLAPWRAGNCGVLGVTSFIADLPGPHVALMALMHGNEFSGAIALSRMLSAGVRPKCGRLSFVFANLEAFDRFDLDNPTHSRFCDEDLNRVWDAATLDGPRQSIELTRARELRPWLDGVDVLLDLHSMLWPSDPLILCGLTEKGRVLAQAIGTPKLVVADAGHVG
ncbi:MAG: succinylglutamate desuccinylase/aspartoacylase family protein, partial [Acetobacteraceae bacterium]|nr:succinylglutamate desuccinylase/aspartoacylase family protein [Acetobacteraceae bacterium]